MIWNLVGFFSFLSKMLLLQWMLRLNESTLIPLGLLLLSGNMSVDISRLVLKVKLQFQKNLIMWDISIKQFSCH